LPTSDVVIDTTTTSGLTIKEASPAEVAKYFPMTSSITGNGFNPEHCNIYTIAISGYLSIASFLTNIEYGQAKFAFIFANGKCKTGDDVAQVFLVKDCTGELDLEPRIDADIIENTPWTCEENGLPPGRENDLYGEWYRVNLRQ
jgi:hypothetical protein